MLWQSLRAASTFLKESEISMHHLPLIVDLDLRFCIHLGWWGGSWWSVSHKVARTFLTVVRPSMMPNQCCGKSPLQHWNIDGLLCNEQLFEVWDFTLAIKHQIIHLEFQIENTTTLRENTSSCLKQLSLSSSFQNGRKPLTVLWQLLNWNVPN